MSIAFQVIASGDKHPGVLIENLPVAQPGEADRPSLIFGQRLASGTVLANTLTLVARAADADSKFGIGSMLAQACAAYLRNDPNPRPLYAMPLADPAGVAASSTINITGPATGSGTLHLYIADQHVPITVVSGQTADNVATAIRAALGINEAAALALGSRVPVTGAGALAAVILTARHAGLLGNQIDIRLNKLGAPAETNPAGIAVTDIPAAPTTTVNRIFLGTGGTAPVAGTLAPVLTTAMLNILDRRYSFVSHPWDDATSLLAFKNEWADGADGRWGPYQMTYGHVFGAKLESYINLFTFATGGTLQQDPHYSCFGMEGCPNPPWEIGAAFAGAAAVSFRANPAKPLNGLKLIGISAPHPIDQFTRLERSTLLDNGITVPLVSTSGEVYILRGITSYFENPAGGAEDQWLDITTTFKVDVINTEMQANLVAATNGKNLADDGTLAASAPNVTTANAVRGILFGMYDGWELRGIVENGAVFRKLVIVERNALDPNRLDVFFPPALIGECQILAIQNQWRLAYTAAEKALAA